MLPSLWEGFGLPVGEALAAGTRVVCSDLPALREIAGEDATYFDPGDPAAIAEGILHALTRPRPDAASRHQLGRRRGLGRRALARAGGRRGVRDPLGHIKHRAAAAKRRLAILRL